MKTCTFATTGTLCATLLALTLSNAAFTQSVTFDYSSLGGALIAFEGQGTGGTISMSDDPSSGFDFQIANANPSSLDGLAGSITGIFAVGSLSNIGPGEQEASVTGVGTMSIFDGSSVLSANISWNTVVSFGVFGALNYEYPNTPANLSNFTYSGSVTSPLHLLADSTSGTNALDFTLSPTASLSSLIQSGGSEGTTFSGSFEAIPEPSTYALVLGFSAVGFGAWRRRRGTNPVF